MYRKLKILFTIPNFDTAGSGIPLLKIAQNLDKNLFEPHIACLHDRGELFKDVQKNMKVKGFREWADDLEEIDRLKNLPFQQLLQNKLL